MFVEFILLFGFGALSGQQQDFRLEIWSLASKGFLFIKTLFESYG